QVFDLSEAACQQLADAGASVAASAADAVVGAEYVISMLPAGKHVAGVYLGDDGLLAQLHSSTTVLDCSTIDAPTSRKVGEAAAALGIGFMDAPVSGGVAAAAAGTLAFMCGGEAATFEKAKIILADMGKNIFHAGPAGAGQVAKGCNNMLLAIHMIGTCEALEMGVRNGLDPKVLSEIMLASSGRNWSLEVYNPYPGVMEKAPASNDYKPGFMVDLMAKDLGLAMAIAEHSGVDNRMGQLAKQLYSQLQEQGMGQQDFSSIMQTLAAKS
ncbi:MAG: 3-hydroxyisobutyrate dehydrogenase, partial [Haliea sp.]